MPLVSGMRNDTIRQLQALGHPHGCIFVRIPKSWKDKGRIVKADGKGMSFEGHFDNNVKLFNSLISVENVNVFVGVNPASTGLLSASTANKLAPVGKNEGTDDHLIVCRSNLFIDIDAKTKDRLKDASATGVELESTVEVRERILDELDLRRHSIAGKSGNGSWILVKLPDLPNDGPTEKLVVNLLKLIGRKYNVSGKIDIDSTVSNASRIMPLVGTLKCKGTNNTVQDRVWRPVTLDTPESHTRESIDLQDWLHRFDDGQVNEPQKSVVLDGVVKSPSLNIKKVFAPPSTNEQGSPERFESPGVTPLLATRVASYLKTMEIAVEGQHGSDATMAVANVLANDFGLTIDQARPFMDEYSAKCNPPWSPEEIEHKLEDALNKPCPSGKPRGHLLQEVQQSEPDPYGDIANSLRLIQRAAGKILYDPSNDVWMTYKDDGRWHGGKAGRKFVEGIAQQVYEDIYHEGPKLKDEEGVKAWNAGIKRANSKAGLWSMVDVARGNPSVACHSYMFDKNPHLLCCVNGTLDIKTGEFRDHRPDDFITMQTPIVYDKNAKAPWYKQTESEVFAGNNELANYIRKLFSISLTGENSIQEATFLVGEGSNGKSLLLGTLVEMLGDYAMLVDAKILSKGERHTTIIYDLRGKRLAYIPECEEDAPIAEDALKRLTGEKNITARQCYGNNESFPRTHKFWIGTNHKPKIVGNEKGIWRRLNVIGFPVEFVDTREPGVILNPPLKLAIDPTREERLKSEWAGILNLLVDAFQDYKKSGLQVPQECRDEHEQYRREQNPLINWIECRCTLDASAMTPVADLYENFLTFRKRVDPRSDPVTHVKFAVTVHRGGNLRWRV